MSKVIVYVAGPYIGKNRAEITDNLQAARHVLAEIYELGAMGIFTPLMTDGFAGIFSEGDMLERDLWMIERADVVYASLGWQDSAGAQQEVNFAELLGKPVFDNLVDLRVWMNARSKSTLRRFAIQGEGE